MPNTLTLRLPPVPASARDARAQVRAMVDGWSPQCVAALQVLVDELVTNVILHARSDAVLLATFDSALVRVEVHDTSQRQPVARHYGRASMTGRGLHLVEALALRWGVREVPDGKIVWFEFACNRDEP
jgi:anti-sigma regulatory factor (Ser/Thr protein kinase)